MSQDFERPLDKWFRKTFRNACDALQTALEYEFKYPDEAKGAEEKFLKQIKEIEQTRDRIVEMLKGRANGGKI